MSIFYTKRLCLRSFSMSDVGRVQKLAGDWEVANTTANIPYPYPLEVAIEWIGSHEKERREGRYTFAIVLKESDLLIGAISLGINKEANHTEIGYWIGKDYWKHGFASEASKEILRFGFEDLKLNRIFGRALARNPVSIRVLEKIGVRNPTTKVVGLKKP